MIPEKPKAGRLYGLAKDHKPVVEGKKIPKLREVVSGSGSNTEMISAYVDHFSNPLVKDLPSYLEDTPHVLRRIDIQNKQGPLPPGTIPVSMDVTALYPSVPQREGLECLKIELDKRADQLVPTSYLISLMEKVLSM